MSKSFSEYKENKARERAYMEASKIQEAFALSIAQPMGGCEVKQYEGHICVSDILAKIDAMTRMFESNLKSGTQQASAEKISAIIDNLYDLAQIKMAEAKKQAKDYIQKASGIPSAAPMDVPEVEPEPEAEPDQQIEPEDEAPKNDEPTFKPYRVSQDEIPA